MKILITGGTGFIGCYFVRAFLEMGHQIHVLDLHPFESGTHSIEPETVKNNPNLTYFQGDVRDRAIVDQSLEGCDAVMHLAAAHHDFGISDETFHDVNVAAAQVLCDAMDATQIRRLCFFSTVAIYGESARPVTESSPREAINTYGKTKWEGEQVFQRWVELGDERQCLTIRPTVTFGVGNFANMFTLIKQIDKGLFLRVGDGSNIKSLSYIENIVDATSEAWLSNPLKQNYQAYNYVCKPDLSSGQIADIIYDELGKKPPRVRLPYWLARLCALPLDLLIAITGKNLPISGARIRKLAVAHTQFESEQIRNDGYQQQISVEEGIRRMVRWYVECGKEEVNQGVKRRLPPELSGQA